MELKELYPVEINSIYGGNELTENFLYYTGVICKGIYYYTFCAPPEQGSYSYGKCGY